MEKKRDSIPNFKAKDTNGNDFDSQMLIVRSRWLFILPQRQYTGMYRASVQFSDQYEDFKDLRKLSESVVIQSLMKF
jgi:peroxiredoxin Q/BCP